MPNRPLTEPQERLLIRASYGPVTVEGTWMIVAKNLEAKGLGAIRRQRIESLDGTILGPWKSKFAVTDKGLEMLGTMGS